MELAGEIDGSNSTCGCWWQWDRRIAWISLAVVLFALALLVYNTHSLLVKEKVYRFTKIQVSSSVKLDPDLLLSQHNTQDTSPL